MGLISEIQIWLDRGFKFEIIDQKESNFLLRSAIKFDQPEMLDFLIKNNLNINIFDNKFGTPLHYALSLENEKAVQILIKNHADLSIIGPDGSIPIFSSLKFSFAVAKLFLDQQNDVKIREAQERTLVEEATRNGNKEIVEYLLNKGAEKTLKALEIAIQSHRFDLIKLLFDKQFDILNENGTTLLQQAMQSIMDFYEFDDADNEIDENLSQRLIPVLDALIKSGANINLQDEQRETILHSILSYKKLSTKDKSVLIKYLLINGADPKIKNYRSKTAIDLARTLKLSFLFS